MEIENPRLTGTSQGFGVPTAGTSGQILSKVNSTNYNTQWVDNGVQATYLHVHKTSTQSIPNNSATVLTSYSTPTTAINAGEWNSTTGVFTATKAGIYSVQFSVQFTTETYSTANTEVSANIAKNGNLYMGYGRWFNPGANFVGYPPSIVAIAVFTVAIGDTISAIVYQASGATKNIHNNGTFLTIKELPSRIIR